MFWWIVLWVILGLFLLIGLILLLPVGVRVIYRDGKLKLWFLIGPVRILFKPKENKEPAKIDYREILKEPIEANRSFDGVLGDFWAEMKTILDVFGILHPKLRIKRIELNLCLAGVEPDQLGLLYGAAQAGIGAVLTVLEQFFTIKKRKINICCDFLGDRTAFDGRLDAVIGLGRLLYCLLKYILSAPEITTRLDSKSETVDTNDTKGGQ